MYHTKSSMEKKTNKKKFVQKSYRIKDMNVSCRVKNNSIDISFEVKTEETEDFCPEDIENTEFEEYGSSQYLYENHTIKEELVIGPEQIQNNLVYYQKYENEKILGNFKGNRHINENTKQHNNNCTEQCFNNNTKKKISHKRGLTETLKEMKCSKCNEKFKTKRGFEAHTKRPHKFKLCKFCNKVFYKTSNANRHEKYFCAKNPIVEKNNKELKYGMFKHLFICDYCGNKYTHKGSLKNHIKTHLGTPNMYKCKFCEKKYTKHHNLKSHINSTHMKIKDYKCKICNKSFSWRFAMTSHEKTHNKKKVMLSN